MGRLNKKQVSKLEYEIEKYERAIYLSKQKEAQLDARINKLKAKIRDGSEAISCRSEAMVLMRLQGEKRKISVRISHLEQSLTKKADRLQHLLQMIAKNDKKNEKKSRRYI